MSANILNEFHALNRLIDWGPVQARFKLDTRFPPERVSNVSIVPIVGDRYVTIRSKEGRYELPGGTLEPGEPYLHGLKREVMEEVGAELVNYHLIGYFDCRSSSEKPIRPHIPHPEFIRLLGYGEVAIVGEPTNPADGEQIGEVELVTIEQALMRLRGGGRDDIADMYALADRIKNSG